MPLITWSDGERHGILVASWRCLESGLGMWNDVRLTEHRLQIRPSDIELHNWWLNYFQLLDVWSKFHRFVIVLYYTDSCAWKRNILFMARRLVGSWKPILQHVPCRISCILPERTWQQTSHMAGGHVPPTGPGHPLCQRLAAVQRNRWLAKAGWQMMAQAFNWPGHVGGREVRTADTSACGRGSARTLEICILTQAACWRKFEEAHCADPSE